MTYVELLKTFGIESVAKNLKFSEIMDSDSFELFIQEIDKFLGKIAGITKSNTLEDLEKITNVEKPKPLLEDGVIIHNPLCKLEDYVGTYVTCIESNDFFRNIGKIVAVDGNYFIVDCGKFDTGCYYYSKVGYDCRNCDAKNDKLRIVDPKRIFRYSEHKNHIKNYFGAKFEIQLAIRPNEKLETATLFGASSDLYYFDFGIACGGGGPFITGKNYKAFSINTYFNLIITDVYEDGSVSKYGDLVSFGKFDYLKLGDRFHRISRGKLTTFVDNVKMFESKLVARYNDHRIRKI